jgi:hypothetical protein
LLQIWPKILPSLCSIQIRVLLISQNDLLFTVPTSPML